MKVLTRDFTNREKVLLLVLGLIILAFLYYLAVYEPVSSGIKNAESEKQMLEDQLVVADAQVQRLEMMQGEVDAMEGLTLSIMPSYNASKAELNFLNSTLAFTQDYYVGFTNVSRRGDQIRRDFSLQFRVPDYAEAVSVLRTLEGSDIRCLISDLSISPVENDETLSSGGVQVNCVGTFYETMHGGIPDQELPEDEEALEPEIETADEI